MKLEKIFEAKEKRLFRIGGDAVDTKNMAEKVRWSDVEPQPEAYDEAFLAALRDRLKAAEAVGKYAFIEPVYDRADGSVEQFTAAMKHCARRIKDCASVAGFALPAELLQGGFGPDSAAASYMAALSEKHAQYVYFCAREAAGRAPEGAAPDNIVLY